jgi:membrane-associated phospholipid phosphatase
VAWTVGPALAIGAGALQIAAGNHFPTDVATGALVGAAVGWTVVELH